MPRRHIFDVISRREWGSSDEEDTAARLQAARQVSRYSLMSWRSRFVGEEALASSYTLRDQSTAEINSPKPHKVTVTHTKPDQNRKIYDFDPERQGDQPELLVSAFDPNGEPLEVSEDPVDLYDQFGRLLYDCDRIQLRV